MWNPNKEWLGQPAYIIGGGSSLRDFDFNSLIGKNTIGCNDAFRKGPEICKICIFGDQSWFQKVKWDLEKYKGIVAAAAPPLTHYRVPWLNKFNRETHGLVTPEFNQELLKNNDELIKKKKDPMIPMIGWNYSTGACAVNLALLFGADPIYLLGFDMSRGKHGKSHWHNHRPVQTSDHNFARFIRGFQAVADAAFEKFPETEIWNVTDGGSNLPVFPKMSFDEFRKETLCP